MTETMYERIAGRQVSLALVLGVIGFVAFVFLTVVFQWSKWMGFDLTQSFTDFWVWVLFTGSGVCLALINYGIWRARPPKPAQPVVPEPEGLETGLNDLAISQVWGYAKMGFMDLLKLNLKLVGDELKDGRIPPKFKSWDEADPELKKHLVANSEYGALDDFAESLAQCPPRDEPNFDIMSDLCNTHYERLKRLSLVS